MAKDTAKVWLGRFPVLDDSHQDDLEARAAIHEFKGKLPRQQAEERSHSDYLKEKALDSAAHHLIGIKAAHAAGHDEAAGKHGEAYAGAMKAAGHDPFSAPPQEVLDRAKNAKHSIYNFKAHEADQLFTPEHREADGADEHIKGLLEKLQGLKASLDKPKSKTSE